MFGLLKKKQDDAAKELVIARLNARVQPIDRGDYYEEPLDDLLKQSDLGEVTGGGTQLADEPAGIEFCDIEILVDDVTEDTTRGLIERLEFIGVPKGSRLILGHDGTELPFGTQEGLGLFLNGSDLPDEVYAESDVNHVIEECNRSMGDGGSFKGYWEGSRETALYFYGDSFAEMKAAIASFVAAYPLCQDARIEQIA